MTAVSFECQGKTFSIEKGEQNWQLILQKSDVSGASLSELSLLDLASPYLLSQEIEMADDTITLTYALPRVEVDFKDIRERRLSEKLRFAINALGFQELLKYDFGLVLNPNNLFITSNLEPKLAYRSLLGSMVPLTMDEADFLRQYKCLVVTLMDEETDFETLYDGGLEVRKLTPFLKELSEFTTIESIEDYLVKAYEEQFKKEEETLTLVSQRLFKTFRYATIWLSAAAVILLVPLIYLVFMRNPFKDKMLDADKSFLKVDYTAVINKLESVPLSKLPYTQKYELAYSYVEGQSLSKDQRNQIMNNVTLKSDELYLDYWIQIGRGKAEDALDTAKRLDDVDLKLYAVVQAIEEVKANDKLSGKDRDSKLSELQGTYKTLKEERKGYLEKDKEDESSTSSTSTPASSSSSQTEKSGGDS